MENYLKRLNDKQLEAVTTIDGPLLVLAGAGSGKTTVLAARVAYILQNTFAKPWNILAITFTNKAAREMRERIERIVGSEAKSMWIGTFHSVCVRILRTCIDREGYDKEFVIYDSADARTLMKECEKELNIEEKTFPVRAVLSAVSNAKNNMVEPDSYTAVYGNNMRSRIIEELYSLYQKKLKRNNALDFDDILMLTVKILKNNPDVAEKYQERFQYILVDEYQDTNNTQYAMIGILAQGYGNICVVGDDDQSIYKFRGANVNNILDFESDYADAKKVMLEQNYRSTSTILNTANRVIANNRKRMGKNLWTNKSDGEKIFAYTASTDRDEADFIAGQIERVYKEKGNYKSCAILYRTNAQSRAIEEALMKNAIPYKVLAGLRFYDRKEIKDITAYLRVIYNPDDDVSLKRIINEPKRKIGNTTIERLQQHASEKDISCYRVIQSVAAYPDLKAAAPRLTAFADIIKRLRKLAGELTIDKFVKKVLLETGYQKMLEDEGTIESQTRLENIEEFCNLVTEYYEDPETSGELGEFLESVTMVSDIDDYDESEDYVVMMTIHSAKGLEFPVVFLTGMEEGVFPGTKSSVDEEETEEERRLCYVAITRAKEKLYVTRAMNRFRFGKIEQSEASRFFDEIPTEYIEDMSPVRNRVKHSLEDFGFNLKRETVRTEVYEQKKAVSMDMSHFDAGDRVRHRKFGDGTVISAQAFGKDSILLIDFDNAGTKRLMAAFAKLEKVE
ncbi:MAG: DNA helicase PcrA [Clostridiales bacterium]|nr:DNA helicase PcrA [Clostridiales bacterium]